MSLNVLVTMVTTTSYGTWLPGDARGYVEDGKLLPPNPRIQAHAESLSSRTPVHFSTLQQVVLFDSLCNAADEFGYRLTDVSVESWHLHWIVEHGCDPVPQMVGRLKNRMRQALKQGRIWTAGYWHRCLNSEYEIEQAREYVARHPGCRMLDGRAAGE